RPARAPPPCFFLDRSAPPPARVVLRPAPAGRAARGDGGKGTRAPAAGVRVLELGRTLTRTRLGGRLPGRVSSEPLSLRRPRFGAAPGVRRQGGHERAHRPFELRL